MDKSTLMGYMPDYYKTSKVMDNICNTNATELNNFNTSIENTLNQFFIDTASFTLSRWEKEFGIDINNNLDSSYRISKIKSKMRGQGTCTVNLIQNVANSFDNGQVQVIEHPSTYTLEIKFISDYGIPPNLSDLKDALSEIIPAHLATIYTYLYAQWSNVKAKTWTNIKATGTWSDLLNGKVI